jgi:hypothetical protein
LLRLFQNIRPVSALLVLIIGLGLRLPAFFLSGPREHHFDLQMAQGFFSYINQNYVVSVIIGLIIVFIQSVWFNRLCITHDVIYAHTWLPAYFYMLVSSVYLENLVFNPVMLINFAILLCFTFLFQLYQSFNSSQILYYSGLFLGAVSVAMPIFYTGIIFLIVGTIIFKNITLKDLLGILSGYIFPAIVTAGIYFLAGSQYHFPDFNYKLDFRFGTSLSAYPAVLGITFLTIAGLMKTVVNYSKNNIKTRRITLLLVSFLVFGQMIIFFKMQEFRLFFPLLTIGFATQLAYFLLGSKNRRWKELIHYLLLAALFYSLYGELLF